MLDINVVDHKELYLDLDACIDYLRGVEADVHPWPDDITTFHVYTEVKSPKELMVIKSFLATQDLTRCRLIVWSDIPINDNPLIQSYLEHIELRVWDPIKEARGTPLEDQLDILESRDYLYWLQSDLLRLLALYKYGGIWVDMDIIFLRDFRPILDQEFMYAWSSDLKFGETGACATVLGLKRQSALATRLLETLVTVPKREATTCWGRDMFARVYAEQPFTVFPCGFFNSDWVAKDIRVDHKFFGSELQDESHLFRDAFAWHWHNSTNKDEEVRSGSKFEHLEGMIHKQLKARGIHEGELALVKQYREAARAFQAGSLNHARRLTEDILSQQPDFSVAWGLLAQIYTEDDKVEQALETYILALKSPYARVRFAIEAVKLMRKCRPAAKTFDFAVAMQSRFCDHPELQLEMGFIAEEVGSFDIARMCYERTAYLRPNDSYPYLRLGLLHRKLDDLSLAREYLEGARKLCRTPDRLRPINIAIELVNQETVRLAGSDFPGRQATIS